METVVTDSAEVAAGVIRRGGLVAFPTETVYGLGADIFDAAAVAAIFKAKRRPADNPLIAHISDLRQVAELSGEVPDAAHGLIDAFFPGPLTIVLRKAGRVPLIATAGLDTIGIRMPSFPLARHFLDACECPVVAPSANVSGRPSPTTWQAVREDLEGRIDCILRGEPTAIGLESTVVDCSQGAPVVLRKGSISISQLQAVVPETRENSLAEGQPARSPGMLHRHYSPRAKVVIGKPQKPNAGEAYIGLSRPSVDVSFSRICSDAEDYARHLFEFFRECDRKSMTVIYCEPISEIGIGAALMDRLRRAAE